MDTLQETKNDKPSWLERLEAESWQAELIISGTALYGSFQLPGLINNAIDYSLIHLPARYMDFLFYIFWYLILTASVLMITFLAHLSLRALWIGMVGLVSVFPNGIQKDGSSHMSPHFLDQLAREFPDINQFNRRLDDFCSTIFAFSFGTVFTFVAINLMLALVMVVVLLMGQLLPHVKSETLFLSLLGLLLFPAVISSLMSLKQLRDSSWVRRIHFPMFRFFSRILFNIFYEPIIYITYTLTTNLKAKSIGPAFTGFFLLIILISVPILINSNAIYFREDAYQRLGSHSDRLYPQQYEDQLDGQLILRPTIPSETISGPRLRLFLPLPKREEQAKEALCGTYTDQDSLSEQENIRQRRSFLAHCLNQYFTIYINDQEMTGLRFRLFDHPNRREPGAVVYLPTAGFRTGENELRIESASPANSKEKRSHLIVFWYNPPTGSPNQNN